MWLYRNWLPLCNDLETLDELRLKLLVVNQRGVLAKVASAISDAESNIENVSFTAEDQYTALKFTLEVNNRQHLAVIMRSLRNIPEVKKIIRVQSGG